MCIRMRGECKFSFSLIITSDQGQSGGSFDKGTGCRVWWCKLNPKDLLGGRRKPTSASCPLISTHMNTCAQNKCKLNNFKTFISFFVHGCFDFMHVCVPHVCLVPIEARRGYQIPGKWSKRWLWATVWVSGNRIQVLCKSSWYSQYKLF